MTSSIQTIPELTVLGNPLVSVVAFASSTLNVLRISDLMSKRGWNLNALQNPVSVHIAVTMISADKTEEFISDLSACVEECKKYPKDKDGGMAAIYGMAATIPDRTLVDTIAKGYLDILYRP